MTEENSPQLSRKNSAGGEKNDWGRSTYADLPKSGETRHCTDPWTFVQVLGNGQTRPCCFSGVVLGFVSDETSFADVYNGEIAQNLRRELLTGELDKFCKVCNMKSIVPVKTLQQDIAQLYSETEKRLMVPAQAVVGGRTAAVPETYPANYAGNTPAVALSFRGELAFLARRLLKSLSRNHGMRGYARAFLPRVAWIYLSKLANMHEVH